MRKPRGQRIESRQILSQFAVHESGVGQIDSFKHLGVCFDETFTRPAEAGRFIYLPLVKGEDDTLAASYAICVLPSGMKTMCAIFGPGRT